MFPSEYDRLNPSTQEEGILQYKKYMEKKIEDLKGVSKEKQAQILSLLGKNAQRSHQMNQGGMNQQFGGAFASLFGGTAQSQYSQQAAVQQPMSGIFPGLFPSVAQSQPNFMQAFPFMMPQAQPQPYRQPAPTYAPNPGIQQRPMNPPRAVSSFPAQMQPQISPQPQMNQANPLAMLNMGGNLNAHVNQVGQNNPQMGNQNAYYRRR